MINVFRRMEYLIKLNEKAKKENLNYYNVKLNDRLPLSKVNEFEQKHNIVLPAEYKKFIVDYANGADGQLMNLLPLEQYFVLYKKDKNYDTYLSNEFRFDDTQQYVAGRGTFTSETEGTITIRKHSTTGFDLLVVSGKDYGSVWHADRKKGLGIVKISSSFRKYLDDRIDDSIKTLVDQERFRDTVVKNRVDCTIIEVRDFEKHRDLIVIKDNTRIKYKLTHQKEYELLTESEICGVLCSGRSSNIVFIIDQAKNFKETKLRGNYYFEDDNSEKRSEVGATSNVIVRTMVLESYRDGFTNKYYTRCRVNNFDSDMYIVTTRDIAHLEDKEVVFKGTVGSLIKGINI